MFASVIERRVCKKEMLPVYECGRKSQAGIFAEPVKNGLEIELFSERDGSRYGDTVCKGS